MILLSTNKHIKTIITIALIEDINLNYSLRLLSLLVSTVKAFEISLFQGPERQYQRFEKVQVSKIIQRLDPNLQNPQLNLSFVSLVPLRSLRSSKNSEPFSNFYFSPYGSLSFSSKVTAPS